MASKRARKSKAPSRGKSAAKTQAAKRPASPANALHNVIRDLIHAKQMGDGEAQESAAAALETFARGKKGPAHLRQAAAQAQAVAANPVMVDSMRLLGDIAARLNAAS